MNLFEQDMFLLKKRKLSQINKCVSVLSMVAVDMELNQGQA